MTDDSSWPGLVARLLAIVRIWYRHDVRRWWRRRVTTHGLEKRLRAKAWRRLQTTASSYFPQLDSSLIQVPPASADANPYDRVVSSRAAVRMSTGLGIGNSGVAHHHLAEEERARQRTYEQLALEDALKTYHRLAMDHCDEPS